MIKDELNIELLQGDNIKEVLRTDPHFVRLAELFNIKLESNNNNQVSK